MPTKRKPSFNARPTMHEQPGAPTKLSAERLKVICDEIAAGASFRDAAHMADISEQTLARWRGRGAAEPDSEFGEFCRALEAARVQRRRWYRGEVLKLAREKKDFRGILAIAALTEPQEFTPKLHMIVEQQFTEAIDRLRAEFETEPDIYERVLQAIVEGPRAPGADQPSVALDTDCLTDFTSVELGAIRSSA